LIGVLSCADALGVRRLAAATAATTLMSRSNWLGMVSSLKALWRRLYGRFTANIRHNEVQCNIVG
jgi:hypothetical protein